MNKSKLYYSSSLAIATFIAETYAALSLEQGLYRIGTGLGQALILAAIAWILFGIGEKKNNEKNQAAKPFILSGLVTWAISSSIFRLLHNSFDSDYISVTVIAPLIIVGAMSYFTGANGGLGKRRIDENR